ncbi:hypothetical protein AOQ84DRAFT_311557 [Glonium stellatum]|uniref:Uncharacterized protein n=1 Tax=Glonium stellatum TaxID=574774 RepID=A0A8E2F9B5_9PEZI|nr:hypothetical protein AOQ84DRAFT_311557 [Glonium stellatum]
MSSESANDANLSGAKIQPLDSETKRHVPQTDHSVVGDDSDINQARIDPLGGRGQYQHPAPHANSQGVVGRDNVLQGAKIAPMEGEYQKADRESQGLDDEAVDGARINPMGSVREEMH